MVGWHHRLNGHEFEQTPGDNERQGSLACCSPWGRRVGHDLQLNNSNNCSCMHRLQHYMDYDITYEVYVDTLLMLSIAFSSEYSKNSWVLSYNVTI